MPPLTNFKRFDVGPALDRGEDPRGAVMQGLEALAANEGVVISAPFLPAPLIELVGGMGFASKVERDSDGTWFVYFWPQE